MWFWPKIGNTILDRTLTNLTDGAPASGRLARRRPAAGVRVYFFFIANGRAYAAGGLCAVVAAAFL